ncbi:MAG: ATPase [Pseudomonadota bacterium]
MIYRTAQDWQAAPHKRIALFGMSGLGKTYLSALMRDTGDWFHYSVDFRIGTRYMGEHIVDNFKREAMRNPFLRELLMSDSLYIASNISFNNLNPLSTYLGKPGDPAKGGIPFEEYVARQRQHRIAEVEATKDALLFADKAANIYGYPHFICDTSGSICEVVDPEDAADPVLSTLSAKILPIWIKGTQAHVDALCTRFAVAPKPMYYNEDFLRAIWDRFCHETQVGPDHVDPDAFIRYGFRQLMDHRLPIYEAIARNWGLTLAADDVAQVRSAHDFEHLVTAALPSGAKAVI